MKVLNINFSIDPKTGGGTAERTFQLSRFLVKNGVACTVLTLNQGHLNTDAIKKLEGVKVIWLRCLFKRFYIPLVSLSKLKSIIKEADIIHLISHWTLLNALAYYWAKRLNKPYVFSPAGALPVYGRSKRIKAFYNWLVGKKLVSHASGYIAITPQEIPQFQAYGIADNKITIIPNGVCQEDFIVHEKSMFLEKLGLSTKKYILFMGRLNPIKGPDLLLAAFAGLPNKFDSYHLVFAGPDEGLLQKLMTVVSEHGLQERVHFIGSVSGQDKVQLYNNSTLLVIPSRQEAMSLVVLEGGILGKPVLMTDQCGFSELEFINGGMLVPASIAAITDGLQKLLSSESDLVTKGQNLKKYVFENFLWDCQIVKLIQLYQKILLIKDGKPSL